MTENETTIRKAYKIADEQDVAARAACFNPPRLWRPL
jgi:hypothetical protein